MNVTYNIKLLTSCQNDLTKIIKVLQLHSNIWNSMSQFIFKDLKNNINKKIIYDKNYHKCRKLFPDSPSQVVIRV